MFNFPATELFNPAGGFCVVWSPEDYAAKLADGWLEERPVEPEPSPAMIADERKRGGKGKG